MSFPKHVGATAVLFCGVFLWKRFPVVCGTAIVCAGKQAALPSQIYSFSVALLSLGKGALQEINKVPEYIRKFSWHSWGSSHPSSEVGMDCWGKGISGLYGLGIPTSVASSLSEDIQHISLSAKQQRIIAGCGGRTLALNSHREDIPGAKSAYRSQILPWPDHVHLGTKGRGGSGIGHPGRQPSLSETLWNFLVKN